MQVAKSAPFRGDYAVTTPLLLRPGNAGSDTFAGHAAALTAALRQIPARMRSKLLVRVDGAGASHELISHLLSLSSRRRTRAVHQRMGHHRRR